MNWFEGAKDVTEVKAKYREVIFQVHPDRHDRSEWDHWNEVTQDLNAAYEAALKGQHGATYTGFDRKPHTYRYDPETERMVMDKLQATAKAGLPAYVTVWLVGTWIWVEGTKAGDRDTAAKLKALGFKWNSRRHKWYWRDKEHKAYRVFSGSFEQLKGHHGASKYSPEAEDEKQPRKVAAIA